jgi:ATP-dependent Clp protease ATP-binding subunit ClpC
LGKITISKDLKEKIAERGYDPKFGARPLRRLLQKYVEDTIAELVVTKKVEIGSKITFLSTQRKMQNRTSGKGEDDKPQNGRINQIGYINP